MSMIIIVVIIFIFIIIIIIIIIIFIILSCFFIVIVIIIPSHSTFLSSRCRAESSNESCVSPPEQKTPSKHGPPQCHTPDNKEDCHTPTNPSPEKTPSAQPSPDQALDDNDTPKRVLRSRKKDIEELRSDSSLKTGTSEERNSPGKHPTTPKRNRVKHLSSPLKRNDVVAKKQIPHVRIRSSTSSSPTANSTHNTGASVSSPRAKSASFAQEDALGQSLTGIAVENKISQDLVKVAIVEETDRSVRTRRSRQDCDEGGSKLAQDLERNEKGGFGDDLTSSKLALGDEQQGCEKESGEEKKHIKTRSAGNENLLELDQGSARRTSLTSTTKTSPAMEAKTLKSPETETKTCVAGGRIESGDETRLKTTEDVEASLVSQNIAVETKKSDHVTPASCTSVQSSVSANMRVCDREETEVAESTTAESTQENQEFYQEKRRTSPRLLAAEKEFTKEASENKSKQQSLSSLSCDVQVKLSDCRGICVPSNKPLLESSSAESETESIRLSTEENLPTSKEAASRNATSEAQDEEISSTPTINCCPSSPNSENSGYFNEAGGGYRLRKRSNQQDQKENENISKRTRSNCNIPDEEQKVDPSQANVLSPFTNVKTKGLTEKSELFKGRGNQTPERKSRKIKGKLKSPSHTAPREKIMNKKDPESESDDSTFSESPRSGPMRETRSMRASVRSLDTEKCAMEATVQPSASSEKTVSVDHLLTLAIPIRDQVPARNNGESNFPQSSFSLEGQAAHGVACLFDSDDENEEFYGFNVPQFDKSFSSEGELSYQINTLVESINRGNTDRNHSDVNNATMTEIFEQTNERVTIKKTADEELTNAGSKEITRGEKANEEISQIEHAEQEQRTRKRKSATDCVGSGTAKRAKSEGAYEEARFRAAYMALSPVDSGASHNDADDDVDDDVFSAVSDSTDGEEEDAESPFSFTSWRQKRKSEDIQPELERPTKRRKSNLRWCDTESGPGPSSLTSTCESYPNCEIERVIEEKGKDATESSGKTTICDEIAKEESSGIAGHRPSMGCASVLLVELNETAVDALGYDAMLEKTNRGRCVSTMVDFNDSYYDDEPIIQTMEERVKLRRTRDDSLKASQNSSSVENQDNEIDKSSTTSSSSRGTSSSTKMAILPLKPLKRVTATTRKDNLPLKPLKRISTSQATSQKVFLPLKPLQRTSSTQSSMKPNRTRSSPSFTRPLPATTFGNTRRPTWIFDQGSFGSSPPEVPRFGAKSFRHSTPTSSKAKYTLRSRKRASWNLKQQDAFAFDE